MAYILHQIIYAPFGPGLRVFTQMVAAGRRAKLWIRPPLSCRRPSQATMA